MSVSQAIGAHVPLLRRFARALTGSQKSGDAYVTAALEAMVADPTLVPTEDDITVALYRLLLTVWSSVEVNRESSTPSDSPTLGAERNLQRISPRPRQAFLLTALEGLTVKQTARAMLISEEKCQDLIEAAAREIAEQVACDVLVIEDEPLIALEVAELANSMGHTVRHVARTHREAIAAVAKHRPHLVLADIQLADGSSGLEAVQEIGQRPEPTYLVASRFAPRP